MASEAATEPFVSVIVPVYNDPVALARCLQALCEQTFPAAKFEVLVIDNASSQPLDGVKTAFPQVTWLYEATPGSYAARNAGLAQARGEILAFTDSDCVPSPTWLQNGVQRLQEHPELSLLAGHIEIFFKDDRRPTAIELFEKLHAFPQQAYVEEIHFGATANVFVRANVAKEVGGFRSGLQSGGDLDFGRRVHAAGHSLAFAPDAVVLHPARSTWKEFYAKRARVVRGIDVLQSDGESRRREALRQVGRYVVPPARSLVRIWGDSRVPTANNKLKYLGALIFAKYVTAWEYLRAFSRRQS